MREGWVGVGSVVNACDWLDDVVCVSDSVVEVRASHTERGAIEHVVYSPNGGFGGVADPGSAVAETRASASMSKTMETTVGWSRRWSCFRTLSQGDTAGHTIILYVLCVRVGLSQNIGQS